MKLFIASLLFTLLLATILKPSSNSVASADLCDVTAVTKMKLTGMLFPWFVSMWLVETVQSTVDRKSRNTGASNKVKGGGNKLKEAFKWKQVDFVFPSEEARQEAIAKKTFIPENNFPLGLEIYRNNVFVSLPRGKEGVPFTLTVINKKDTNKSPLLRPYPDAGWHTVGDCNGLQSVFRMSVDSCGRLWVLDTGAINLMETINQICPPQIVVFDAKSGKFIQRYKIPEDQKRPNSLFINIVVDVRNRNCDDAYAYMADDFGYGMLVYSLEKNKTWRIDHPYFYPDPMVARYDLDGLVFRWTDGIFGLALSPLDEKTKDKKLYFHPLSSFQEFSISTAVLRDENRAKLELDAFKVLREPRGIANSHATGSAMDRDGILYYNLVTQNAVGCWNSYNGAPHFPGSQGLIEKNNVTLSFPNDIKVDQEIEQSIWILSDKLHIFTYSKLDPNEYNFHILTAKTKNAVYKTVCQPGAFIPWSKKVCYDKFYRR